MSTGVKLLRYGFRFSTIKHTMMSERICVIDVDFYTDRPGCVQLERRIPVQVQALCSRGARDRRNGSSFVSLKSWRDHLLQILKTGTVHACMAFWEVPLVPLFPSPSATLASIHLESLLSSCRWCQVYADRERQLVMSTDPAATVDNFPRDMQWGQALQLIEDKALSTPDTIAPMCVAAGEWVNLVVRLSKDNVVMQFDIERMSA